MRSLRLVCLGLLVGATPSVVSAQTCSSATATPVTVRQINAVPQANIDQLEAAGDAVTPDQIQALLTSDLEGACVTFTAVLLTDPLLSGLASLNSDGIPYRVHTFVRDVAAAVDGVAGMGIQLTDARGDGEIQQYFPGDEIVVTGVVAPFRGGGGVAMQVDVVGLEGTGSVYGAGDPLRQPVEVSIDGFHDVVGSGAFSTQIDWTGYAEWTGQYVRLENLNVARSVESGGRVDALFTDSFWWPPQINLFDTSVCFRNDRGEDYFPNGGAPDCIADTFALPDSSVIHVQGFLTFQGDDGGFGYSGPGRANFVVHPFDASDLEVVSAPPNVSPGPLQLATASGGLTISATVAPGPTGSPITAVEAVVSGIGAPKHVPLTHVGGDVYEGVATGLVAGHHVTYRVSAWDESGARAHTELVSRFVVEGPISTVQDVQATPFPQQFPNTGLSGPSGVTTEAPVPFDLSATVQTAFQAEGQFLVTIQDDPDFGAFSGVWVSFGATDPELSPGDRILVTEARVEEVLDVTRLVDVTFTTTGSGDPLGEKVVPTDYLASRWWSEQHEGVLLAFEDVTVTSTNADAPEGPFGEFIVTSTGATYGVRVDDYSDAVSYPGDDPSSRYEVGDPMGVVRGPVYFSFGTYKLAPPSFADIDPSITSVVVDGPRGSRFLGPPASGITVDDLAAQNLVRGVLGYYPAATPPNLWTRYDAEAAEWVVSEGTGEVLELGRAFRWFFYDRAVGNPDVSRSVELPFTLSTERPANTDDVTLELVTGGTRFNHLANPFAQPLDLTGIGTWPGAENLAPAPIQVYDPVARAWVDAPASVGPWEAFRVRAKGPRLNGQPRTLTIPASALAPTSARARRAAPPAALDAAAEAVREVALAPVAPNPTAGPARVRFAVPESGPVRLAVYDVRGREVAALVDRVVEAGRHEAPLDAGRLAPGVYVVRLEAAGTVLTRRATVVR